MLTGAARRSRCSGYRWARRHDCRLGLLCAPVLLVATSDDGVVNVTKITNRGYATGQLPPQARGNDHVECICSKFGDTIQRPDFTVGN
jgi:hypothetical protein